jgi:hypothetical protein
MSSATIGLHRLTETHWQAAAQAHRDRVDALVGTHPPRHRDEAGNDVIHPVWGFLFTYYSFRPAQLRRWHPGFGFGLAGPAARRYLDYSGYTDSDGVVAVDARHLDKRRGTVDYIAELLEATRDRPARLNCFGLHEWAMVYSASPEQTRHAGVPLRLSPDDTDAVVRSLPLRCTHYDAYRFFTEPAQPLNLTVLNRATQPAFEQPGCIHAGMDLYKWAYKLSPLIPSRLVADAFELALDFRELDMRASPYDLSALGFAPITIEDASGRADYVRAQAALGERAQALRSRLVTSCRVLVADHKALATAE